MSINLVTKYVPYLDKKLAYESRTSVLDTNKDLIKETADAKTIMIASLAMSGLGDYSRSTGFDAGSVNLTWTSYTFNYDRSVEFSIDAMDDAESLGILFGNLAGEFLRTKVAPEIDAIRFATYAQKQGYTVADANYDASTIAGAIDTGLVAMEDNEVPMDDIVIFITPTNYKFLKESSLWDRPLAPSENPNRNFGSYDGHEIVKVPQSRFYSKVTLYDGSTAGQTDGGYVKADDGKNINFALISKRSVIQISKHAVLKTFTPEENQKKDAYLIQYRVYHDAWVLGNKDEGVYVSCADESTD